MHHRNYLSTRAIFSLMAMVAVYTTFAQQYDIYVYDVKTHGVSKATNVQGSSFNASWNNNGKKIAHDVLNGNPFPFQQDIYITDLTTGGAPPVRGGQGGNDAVCSPDAPTFLFDAWYFYFYYYCLLNTLYSIPSGGETRPFTQSEEHTSQLHSHV